MGKHYDLEMQIIHNAKEFDEKKYIKYSAISIFFDASEFDKIITTGQNETTVAFIDSLQFHDHSDPTTGNVPLGDFMEIVDFNHKWMYKGSMT